MRKKGHFYAYDLLIFVFFHSLLHFQKYDEQEALGTPTRVIEWINGVLAGDVSNAVSAVLLPLHISFIFRPYTLIATLVLSPLLTSMCLCAHTIPLGAQCDMQWCCWHVLSVPQHPPSPSTYGVTHEPPLSSTTKIEEKNQNMHYVTWPRMFTWNSFSIVLSKYKQIDKPLHHQIALWLIIIYADGILGSITIKARDCNNNFGVNSRYSIWSTLKQWDYRYGYL